MDSKKEKQKEIYHEIKNALTIINMASFKLNRMANLNNVDPVALLKYTRQIENASFRISELQRKSKAA